MAEQKVSTAQSTDVTRKVVLEGLTDIMFDRYPGDNKTQLQPAQKMYFSRQDNKTVILPSLNIMSLLSAKNTMSAPKRLMDSRKYVPVANACLSFISITPQEIPFIRNGKPIVFGGFNGDTDKTSGIYIHRAVARLDKGVPNPKERPTLPTPWELHFTLSIEANEELLEQQLTNLVQKAGRALGLGTFRGVFGKFRIAKWE